jgi:uncharacterized LabA/DUF88 family protein
MLLVRFVASTEMRPVARDCRSLSLVSLETLMERLSLFLDIANLESAFRKAGAEIDWLGLRDYLVEGRVLVEALAYLPISPYNPERRHRFADFLQRNGFLVRSKIGKPRPGNRWKCNFDVEVAVDVMRCVEHGRVDIIVLGTGDGDMLQLCNEVRALGVRCEIAATREAAAEELLDAASGYIDLGSVIREQREEIIGNISDDGNQVTPGVEETHSIS